MTTKTKPRESAMHKLVGKTVQALRIDEDGQHYLAFDVDGHDEPIIYVAVGDCCSEAWFADIINPQAILGHTITDAVDLFIGASSHEEDIRCRQEYDEIMGVDLYTSAGVCNIIFRNSSNGYYDGWLEEYKQGPMPDNFKFSWLPITADYST